MHPRHAFFSKLPNQHQHILQTTQMIDNNSTGFCEPDMVVYAQTFIIYVTRKQ